MLRRCECCRFGREETTAFISTSFRPTWALQESHCWVPLASLEVLIFSFDLEDSLKLERQIRDGFFPSLRHVQTPDVYRLDRDGRVHRAVSALKQTMIAKTMNSNMPG